MRKRLQIGLAIGLLAALSFGCHRDDASANNDAPPRRLGAGGSAYTPSENVLYQTSLRAQAITVATVNGALINKRNFRKGLAVCDVGTLGGTTPTLDVKLQDAAPTDSTVLDGAATAGTQIVTSATIAFVATDVGLRLTLEQAGPGNPATVLDTIIVSLNSGTSVNVANVVGATVSTKAITVYGRPGTPADVTGATFTQFTTARSGLTAVANVDVQTKRQWMRLVAVGAGTTPTGSFSCGITLLYPEQTPISPPPSPAPDFTK